MTTAPSHGGFDPAFQSIRYSRVPAPRGVHRGRQGVRFKRGGRICRTGAVELARSKWRGRSGAVELARTPLPSMSRVSLSRV
jgi:hypothetical protein